MRNRLSGWWTFAFGRPSFLTVFFVALFSSHIHGSRMILDRKSETRTDIYQNSMWSVLIFVSPFLSTATTQKVFHIWWRLGDMKTRDSRHAKPLKIPSLSRVLCLAFLIHWEILVQNQNIFLSLIYSVTKTINSHVSWLYAFVLGIHWRRWTDSDTAGRCMSFGQRTRRWDAFGQL